MKILIKDKIKSIFKAKNKILALGFIVFILVGIFGPTEKVQAQASSDQLSKYVTCVQTGLAALGDPSTYEKNIKTIKTSCTSQTLGNLKEPIVCISDDGATFQATNTTSCASGFKELGSSTTIPKPADNNSAPGAAGNCTDNTGKVTASGVSDPSKCPTGSTFTNNAVGSTGDNSQLFGSCKFDSTFSVGSCMTSIGYFLLVSIPGFILYITAYIFNATLALTLGTVLYKNNFLPEAWRIVRDFSNIFFILVLLYISIKMILDIGGAELKRMIVWVIISAMLINFSMFMTQVVIDSSNILALIFYNKIDIVSANKTGDHEYTSVVSGGKNSVVDKDIAGGIVTAFNPAHFINPNIGKKLNVALESTNQTSTGTKAVGCAAGAAAGTLALPVVGTIFGCYIGTALTDAGSGTTLPFAIALAVEVTAGAIYLFAAWTFFVAGWAFLARLIELWILIIVSPFAFMSLSVPELQKKDYIGWDKWIERLFSAAFMAPIFMFFLLIITKLVQIDILKDVLVDPSNGSIPRILFMLLVPALLYLGLLNRATDIAKKGAGEIGEAAVKYGKMAAGIVGGLALTAASGGASVAIGGGLGAAASGLAKRAAGKEARGERTLISSDRYKKIGGFLQKSTFDPRNIKTFGVGGQLSKAGLGKGREGSWNTIKEKQKEKRIKRAEEKEKFGTGSQKKAVEKIEIAIKDKRLEDLTYNGVTQSVKLHMEAADRVIEKARQELNDAAPLDKPAKAADLATAKANKSLISAAAGMDVLEADLRTAKNNLEKRSDSILKTYANQISSNRNKILNQFLRLGAYSRAGADEAAREIRLKNNETKKK